MEILAGTHHPRVLSSESSDSDSDESISAPAPADKSYVEVETSARMNPTGTVDFDSS
jgi:hypothetical protein